MGNDSGAMHLEEALSHVNFAHNDADGWVTLAKKMKDGSFKQYHYRPEEIPSVLSKWLGEDAFFSQNTFYKPQRRIDNIRQLRALYVDIDCYLLNYDPDWVIGKLELEIFGESLPAPNIIIHSGRGVIPIWTIEAVPYKAMPLWRAVQDYFVKQLKHVGGDAKATDAARVFRVAGSVNSKSNELVHVEYRHNHRYSLREIQEEYLPELQKRKKKGRPTKIIQLHNIYRLHHTRLKDLVTLVELRDYKVNGFRELICFLYRYWSCCELSDPTEALRHTLELNDEFSEPLPKAEVERATLSAEKAWEKKSNAKANEEAISRGYPGAGYNLKNSKLIEWLQITKEEQVHLQTIIDGPEKRRRKRHRDMIRKREERGSVSRETYLEAQQTKTTDKLDLLRSAISNNPDASVRKLSKITDLSVGYIHKLKKQL